MGETGKGDSYLSELIRIKIFGENSNGDSDYVQVVLKTIPKSISRRLTFRCKEFFENEIIFYIHVLPKLLEFQATKNLKVQFDNYTKLFHAKYDGENDFIMLEDANIESFGPAVRQKGIDLDHCKVTLDTFAKFHAISFAMKDQRPEEFEKISSQLRELYYDQRLKPWYERFWARVCGMAIDTIEKECPRYLKEIQRFAVPETYDRLCQAVLDSKKNGVISHGDSWTNNFLYKYIEDRKPLDAKMIDFQLARCGSPVLDISFFIYACTTQDLRERHYFELLEYYYKILSSQIAEMGSDPLKIYSWESFMCEMKRYSFFGLAFSFESIPFIVLEPEDAINMEMKVIIKKTRPHL